MFEDARISPNLRRLKEDLVGDISRTLCVLMGALGIVRLIACVSRSSGRRALRNRVGDNAVDSDPRQGITRMFVRQGLALSGIGAASGLAVAFALTKMMQSMLFNVRPADPPTYVVASAGLILAAILASYLPGMKVDPVVTLRCTLLRYHASFISMRLIALVLLGA
jgi:putative ABC transport system permease protein